MTDNIKSIDLGKKDERQAAIEKLKREIPHIAEGAALLAKVRRIHYLAYLEEGFTADQAILLCQG